MKLLAVLLLVLLVIPLVVAPPPKCNIAIDKSIYAPTETATIEYWTDKDAKTLNLTWYDNESVAFQNEFISSSVKNQHYTDDYTFPSGTTWNQSQLPSVNLTVDEDGDDVECSVTYMVQGANANQLFIINGS